MTILWCKIAENFNASEIGRLCVARQKLAFCSLSPFQGINNDAKTITAAGFQSSDDSVCFKIASGFGHASRCWLCIVAIMLARIKGAFERKTSFHSEMVLNNINKARMANKWHCPMGSLPWHMPFGSYTVLEFKYGQNVCALHTMQATENAWSERCCYDYVWYAWIFLERQTILNGMRGWYSWLAHITRFHFGRIRFLWSDWVTHIKWVHCVQSFITQ